MIKFIDTNQFVDGSTISVILYSDDTEKSKKRIKSLISGESILRLSESEHLCVATIAKDNITIVLKNMPLNTSSRGHRSQYALIDQNVIGHEHGAGILQMNILPNTIMYHYLLKEKDIKFGEVVNIMLF